MAYPHQSIGGIQNEAKSFETQEIALPIGSMIYLSSDRMVNQNDDKRKRFGEKRLHTLITQVAALPLPEQQVAFEKALNEHQGNNPQRDDILMIGVRL
ncbi:PP2C family protein-serine/threonine phosphatase [Eisenibacter elegans]|uniref:PP2C family protein-serine/threonine phosphatase n=1 Tax=Eisenibacter elegans TaxID=997 RepID=UPI00047AE340|nr:SpoIIE family protein phosphatase [Eisenibacter elegans]